MSYAFRSIIIVHIIMCSMTSSSAAGASNQTMKISTATEISRKVMQSHCGNVPYRVLVLKNSTGLIGGYVLQPLIMDFPISYLDCNGNFLTLFHIFDSDENKAKAMNVIEPLTAEFPLQQQLDCISVMPEASKSP